MNPKEHSQTLKEYGVTILPQILSEDFIERCKENIFNYFSDDSNNSKGYRTSGQTIKSNGFNYDGLKTCAEILETQEVRLWPDKTKTENGITAGDEEYKVYRLATYLTEHTEEDGPPFFVKPKSHTSSYTNISYPDAYEVNAQPGDVVIFHARLRHQGGNSKEDRAAMFWAFGEDNLHSKYHSMAAIKRQINQNLEDEYILSKHMSDIFDKHNIVYDISDDELKHFMDISPTLDSY